MKPLANTDEDIEETLPRVLTSGMFLDFISIIDLWIKGTYLNDPRWEYVQKHDVQLPDEYDQIYYDLEPFWGLEPSYLLELQAEREFKQDTFTIGKNAEGKLDILQTSFQEGAYDQLIWIANKVLDILRDIEDDLPFFRATFTPHDGPNLMTDYVVKSTLLEAASTDSCALLSFSSRLSVDAFV